MKKLCVMLLTVLLISLIPMQGASAAEPVITAKSAILVDAVTGEVLFEKNPHEKLPPASVTKIMTMLILMEKIEGGELTLADQVTISANASGQEGTRLMIETGEVRTVEELLYGVAVESGNDAAVALAEKMSGNVGNFVALMNQRAKELGMNDTNFVNPCGLSADEHYTSAYDIALMSRELIKHPLIFKYITTWMVDVHVGKNNEILRTLANTNKLLSQKDYIDGIKTGFTDAAGYCVSITGKKGDLRLISVIMKAETSAIRSVEADGLLQYGFQSYQAVYPIKKNDTVGEINVLNADENTVKLTVDQDVYKLLPISGSGQITKSLVMDSEQIYAPVAEKQKVGKLIVKIGDEQIAEIDVYTAAAVKKCSYFKYLTKVKSVLFP